MRRPVSACRKGCYLWRKRNGASNFPVSFLVVCVGLRRCSRLLEKSNKKNKCGLNVVTRENCHTENQGKKGCGIHLKILSSVRAEAAAATVLLRH